MCGIAGFISRGKLTPFRIAAALQAIHHRGPDARGAWETEIAGRAIGLLHTRLSILDLDERSNQPFEFDGRHLTFNGEIYNYVELRSELERKGHQFRTRSDTEVLLHAYVEWGLDCLDRMEGMWAFAIVDTVARKLILSRDRFGEKPLFMMRRHDEFYFASEPRALSLLAQQSLEVNAAKVAAYLVNGYKSIHKTTTTFYENVTELPRATVMSFTLDGNEQAEGLTYCYWRPRFSPRNMDRTTAVENLRNRLLEALSIRLRADVPMAFCLSGGLDSSTLAIFAARELEHDVRTFSIIDSDARYDESANIAEILSATGLKNTSIHLKKGNFLDRLEHLVACHNAPVATISYFVHSFLSQAIAAEGCKVAISGTGADELFTGYYDHYSFWLAAHRDHPQLNARVEEWRNGMGRHVRNPLLKDPGAIISNPGSRSHVYYDRNRYNSYLLEPLTENFSEKRYCDDVLRNRMLNELQEEVVPVILDEDDRNSMSVSIENRSPYLDRRLTDFAFSIPSDLLVGPGRLKELLREAAAGYVPDRIRLNNEKKGFNASLDSLLDRNDRKMRDRILDASAIYDIVRHDAIVDMLAQDRLDDADNKFLFSVLSAKAFLESVPHKIPVPDFVG